MSLFPLQKKKKKQTLIKFLINIFSSFHSSFCYVGVWTPTAVSEQQQNNVFSVTAVYGFDSWQNKHMGLEATVCVIGYLAPDLIMNVTFDTYMKCYITYNICLIWKNSRKEYRFVQVSLSSNVCGLDGLQIHARIWNSDQHIRCSGVTAHPPLPNLYSNDS